MKVALIPRLFQRWHDLASSQVATSIGISISRCDCLTYAGGDVQAFEADIFPPPGLKCSYGKNGFRHTDQDRKCAWRLVSVSGHSKLNIN